MKIIKEVIEKYYPDQHEQEEIRNCKLLMMEIANHLGITYMTFYRKLYRKNGQYFTRMEVEKLQQVTGLVFNLH